MSTIEFENGQQVEFDGDPTPEDVDFVAQQLGITSSTQRQERLGGELMEAQKESEKGLTGRFLKELPGETARAFLKQPAKLAVSGALTPIDIARQLGGGKPVEAELPFVGKTFQAEAQQRLEQGASALGTVGRAALEVPLAGAETLFLGKGISAAKRGVTALGQKRALGKALIKTAPKFTPTQEQAAKEAGRVFKTTFGKVKLQPSPKDIEVAESVKNLRLTGNPFKNINKIRNEIKDVDSQVQVGLSKNDTIFNLKQLRSQILKVKEESRVVFGTDKSLERTYTSVVDEMVRQANKNQKNLSGLLRARKNFDRIIEKKFPNIFNNLTTDAPRTNAVLDTRRAVNDFIANKLPQGNEFKMLLKKENLMFEAIKNIAAKSPRLGTSAVGRFLKRPIVKGAGLVAGGGLGVETIRRLTQ